MKKFFLLQRIDTKEYFGTYRGDDYWTKNINDAFKYDQKENFKIDDYTEIFLQETNCKYFQLVEILVFE